MLRPSFDLDEDISAVHPSDRQDLPQYNAMLSDLSNTSCEGAVVSGRLLAKRLNKSPVHMKRVLERWESDKASIVMVSINW